MGKREDLQFLRGIAVLAVVLYHFFPNFVPNGFVGVDQFFVLSGFLMMMVYGSREITIMSSIMFYYRRVKRIVPLYLMALIATVIIVYFFFPISFMLGNGAPRTPALFYTNIHNMRSKNSYFEQLERGSYLYTHTWSLGVEMQFYVIAPLFFFALKMLARFHVVAEFAYLAVVIFGSLASHILLDETIAFNSLPCRLWQFAVGIICFRLCEIYHANGNVPPKNNEKANETIELYVIATGNGERKAKNESDRHALEQETVDSMLFFALLFTILFLVFVPYKEYMVTIRVLVTILTGCIIVVEPVNRLSPMKNKVLCYLGDISYSLYLIHWAACSYARYTYDQESYQYYVILASCFVLAAISYELIEKSYLKLGMISIGVLIAVLYTAIFGAVHEIGHLKQWSQNRWNNTICQFNLSALTKENIVMMNEMANFNDHQQLIDPNCFPNRMFGRCDYKSEEFKKKAGLSVLVIGNSYASNQVGLVVKHFAELSRSITRYSYKGCEVLVKSTLEECQEPFDHYYDLTKRHKPDALFVMARSTGNSHAPINGPISDDQYVKEMSENLKTLEKSVKRTIYLLNYLPQVSEGTPVPFMGQLNRLIRKSKPIIGVSLIGHPFHVAARQRLEEAVKMCKKCVLYDYMPLMSDAKGVFRVADPATGLTYFTGSSHLTEYGLEAVEPAYEQLADTMEKQLEWAKKVAENKTKTSNRKKTATTETPSPMPNHDPTRNPVQFVRYDTSSNS